MNKTAIKNFAVWARNKLIADISYRAGLMGITESGIASALPQSTGTTEFYDIGTAEPYAISGDAVRQRRRLVELIERKAKETDCICLALRHSGYRQARQRNISIFRRSCRAEPRYARPRPQARTSR